MEASGNNRRGGMPQNDQTSCNQSDSAIKAISYVKDAASTSNSILLTHAPQSSESAFSDTIV
jgi:hypothetical protein